MVENNVRVRWEQKCWFWLVCDDSLELIIVIFNNIFMKISFILYYWFLVNIEVDLVGDNHFFKDLRVNFFIFHRKTIRKPFLQ